MRRGARTSLHSFPEPRPTRQERDRHNKRAESARLQPTCRDITAALSDATFALCGLEQGVSRFKAILDLQDNSRLGKKRLDRVLSNQGVNSMFVLMLTGRL